jgi:hypothetical protein
MKHRWTSGRAYDEHGQRMVAMVEGQKLLFSDLSRHIDGAVPLGNFLLGRDLSKYDIEALVMANYDFGNYSASYTTLNWED